MADLEWGVEHKVANARVTTDYKNAVELLLGSL